MCHLLWPMDRVPEVSVVMLSEREREPEQRDPRAVLRLRNPCPSVKPDLPVLGPSLDSSLKQNGASDEAVSQSLSVLFCAALSHYFSFPLCFPLVIPYLYKSERVMASNWLVDICDSFIPRRNRYCTEHKACDGLWFFCCFKILVHSFYRLTAHHT